MTKLMKKSEADFKASRTMEAHVQHYINKAG